MPMLNDNTRRKLNAYRLDRNGQIAPGTDRGALHTAACWSWALTGGYLASDSPLSAISIYAAIMGNAFVPDPRNPDAVLATDYGAVINDVDDDFPGCVAEFATLRANFQACRDADIALRAAEVVFEQFKVDRQGDDSEGVCAAIRAARIPVIEARDASWMVARPEKVQFMQALMSICARRNGLVPAGPGDASVYTLHMRSSRWYGWDHWGIGVRTLPAGQLTFIQTVPNHPLCHSSNVMWDEHMIQASIGIAGLLQNHVDAINLIPPAPVRLAKCGQNQCNATHGWLFSLKNHWHRCTTCGTVWCPTHGSSLAGKTWNSQTRTCNVCQGRTELLS